MQIIEFLTSLAVGLASLLGFGPVAPKPCLEPISYRIEHFDRRFGLSYSDFTSVLKEAEGLWESSVEKATGQSYNLFAYDAGKGALPINLIYDYRQETTQALDKIEGEVKSEQTAYKSLKQVYEAKKLEYQRLVLSYQSGVESFNQKSAEYQELVKQWNMSSRTNRNQFNALEAMRVSLEAEVKRLDELKVAVESRLAEVNSYVSEINSIAHDVNAGLETYSQVGGKLGEEFTGGLYIRDDAGQRVEVYEFSTHAKLVRVLAHELGHALGLEHVSGKGSIMYEVNDGNTLALSESDVAEFKRICPSK